MSQYVHHPDLTCLAQAMTFDANHGQIERYTYPFSGPPSMVKTAVRRAVQLALEARQRRRMTSGRIHVELDLENPGAGRVVDHLPRGDGRTVVDGHEMVIPAEEVESDPVIVSLPEPEPRIEPEPVSVDPYISVSAVLSKQHMMAVLDARGLVNKQPFEIDGVTYQPRSLKIIGTRMEYDRQAEQKTPGLYRGDIRLQKVEDDKESKAIDFAKLPGMNQKRRLVNAG